MGEIAPEEQFLPLSTIFYYLMLDFYAKTGIRFSLRDKRLFEITEVEITRVDCIYFQDSSVSGSQVSQLPSVTDRQTDGWTGPNQYAPSTSTKKIGGIKK